MKSWSFLTVVVLFLAAPLCQADNPFSEALKALTGTGRFTKLGSVCEKLAQLHINKRFPPDKFYTRSNISYGRKDHLSRYDGMLDSGELDVVVFTKANKDLRIPGGIPVLVAEVKCRSERNWYLHLAEAQEQLENLQFELEHSGGLKFYKRNNKGDIEEFFDETKFFINKDRLIYETYSQKFEQTLAKSAFHFTHHDFGFTTHQVRRMHNYLKQAGKALLGYRKLPHAELYPKYGTCRILFAN